MSYNKNINAISDYEDVLAAVVDGYVEGLAKGNFDTIMETFHDDASMYGFFKGDLLGGSIRNLNGYIEQFGAGPDMKSRLDVLAMTPTTAVVRIELEHAADGGNYTDYHSLLKVDGKWKVVSKLFHLYD